MVINSKNDAHKSWICEKDSDFRVTEIVNLYQKKKKAFASWVHTLPPVPPHALYYDCGG